MNQSRFTGAQIIGILKEQEGRTSTAEMCRKNARRIGSHQPKASPSHRRKDGAKVKSQSPASLRISDQT